MRSFLLSIIALFAILSISHAQRIPGCGFGNLDFSPLNDFDLYYYGSFTYVLRMCGSVRDSICLADTTTLNSMVCQRRNSSSNDAYSLITWRNNGVGGSWGAEAAGITYQVANGELCGTNQRSTTIHLQCDAAATTPYISSVTEPSTCQYHVYVRTSLSCTPQASCGFLGIDLTNMFSTDLTWTTPTGSGTVYNWYLNLCSRVNNAACQADSTAQNATLCQRRQDGSDAFAIANFDRNAIAWTVIPSGANAGLQATLSNGEYCGAISANRILRVRLVCDRSLGQTASYISGIAETSTCQYEVTVFTVYTCPIVPSSTGGALISSSSWWPADQPCVFTALNTGKRIDLTALKNGNDVVYEGFIGGTYYHVYFHMCGVVRDPQCLNDSTTYNSMICQASVTNTRDNWALGTFNPSSMIWAETRYGFQYHQETGEYCGAYPRSVSVEFQCKSNAGHATIISMSEPTTCQYVMVVQTSLACNGTNEVPRTSNDDPLYPNCVYRVGNKQYDFKTINPADGSDLTIFTSNSRGTYNIYLRMCSRVKNLGCLTDGTSQRSMICQQLVPATNSISLADYVENNMIWGQLPGQQVIRLKMINGEPCGEGKLRTVTVDFVCDRRFPIPTIISYNEPDHAMCEYVLVVSANHLMCDFDQNNPDGNSGSSDMNGGMVALIVIVIILGLILIIGAFAAYRYYGRPYAFQKDTVHKDAVEMHGEAHNTGYEHEESQSTV